MNCKESICRNCFHSYVCEQFNENKDDNNEKCHFFNDHYVPAADVVLKNEWISVEDRLPEIDPHGKGRYGGTRSVRVLCVCKQRDGRIFVKEGYYEPCGDGSVYWRIPGSIDSVTHWMPLPAPPTEKEN